MTSDQARSGPCGTGSARTSAITRAATMPTTWVTATTARSGARRLSMPPPKSPVPQVIADARPRSTTARPDPVSGRRHPFGLGVDVRGHRTRQLHHAVGDVVVAIRGGQVDHLEGRGQLPEQPQG